MATLHAPGRGTIKVAAFLAAIAFMASAPAGAAGASASASDQGSFYVRAGIAFDRSRDARFQDAAGDCISPTHVYLPRASPCIREGNDGTTLKTVGDFGSIAGFEIGAGYATSAFLRLEGGIRYRPGFSFRGHSNFRGVPLEHRQAVSADVSSLTGMLAAYVDLPGFGTNRSVPINPFFGGGIGLSRIKVGETRMRLPATTFILPEGHRTNTVWMLTAGVAVPMGERAILDVAWRYTDSGTVETGRGAGRVVWRDGSREPLRLDVAETRARLASHGLQISVRYSL